MPPREHVTAVTAGCCSSTEKFTGDAMGTFLLFEPSRRSISLLLFPLIWILRLQIVGKTVIGKIDVDVSPYCPGAYDSCRNKPDSVPLFRILWAFVFRLAGPNRRFADAWLRFQSRIFDGS